uniref:Adenosine receptor B1a n=1 Tax=Callorhinchus milii TaxID=7868 RepID=A0A4W3HF81_CALMI
MLRAFRCNIFNFLYSDSLTLTLITPGKVSVAALSTLGNALVCASVLGTGSSAPSPITSCLGVPRYRLHLCHLMLSVLIVLTQSSIFSMAAVAADRYVAIFLPLSYNALMTPRNAGLTILAAWALSFLIGLVPLMGWHLPPPPHGYCFFISVVDMRYMVIFNFFLCVLAPLVGVFAVYAKIFTEVRRQVRRAVGQGGCEVGKETKTTASLFLVLFLFALCWLPLHLFNCVLLLCPACPVPGPALQTAIILSHANSAINPILYAYKMKSFRRAFKALFLSLACKASALTMSYRTQSALSSKQQQITLV